MDDVEFEQLLQTGQLDKFNKGQLAMFVVRFKPLLQVNEAARLIGVDHHDVTAARQIQQRGVHEVWEAVESGNLPIDACYKLVRQFTREEQADRVAEMLQVTPDAMGRRYVSQRGASKASPKRSIDERVTRSLDQLQNAMDMLEEFVGENGCREHPDFFEWIRQAYKVKTRLTAFIKKHMEAV